VAVKFLAAPINPSDINLVNITTTTNHDLFLYL
jgi:hypothetical protein